MKLKYLLLFTAMVSLVYGIPFVLMPAPLLPLFGLTPNPALSLAMQFLGVELIAIGLVTWFARNISDSPAERAIILAIFIAYLIGTLVAVMGTASGVVNALGWLLALLYLLQVAGYAYFLFVKPRAA